MLLYRSESTFRKLHAFLLLSIICKKIRMQQKQIIKPQIILHEQEILNCNWFHLLLAKPPVFLCRSFSVPHKIHHKKILHLNQINMVIKGKWTSSQKLGRHALHWVRSVWKSLGWVSFGSKSFWVKKKFGSKKFLGQKSFLGKTSFLDQKKLFKSKKKMGQQNFRGKKSFWVKKVFQAKKVFGPKHLF